MSQSSAPSCSRLLSILLILTTLALFHNWTSRNNILAYDISGYEEDALSWFRELVQDLATKDYMKSDGYLLRWLRYTDFDVEKAYTAFEDSIHWRKENKVDSILEEGYSSIEENYKYSLNGFDKEGRPVLFLPLGSFDIRKVTISGEQYKYERSFIRALELAESYLQEIRDQTGFDNITQIVLVDDLAGFNLKQTACLSCLKVVPNLFAHVETNYPLIFHKIFVINAPAISHSAVQIGKHLLSELTQKSLQVFGYDKDNWSKALLEQISPENLPIKYGGIKPDFDKESYAIRNAGVIHLLGNGEHGSGVKADTNIFSNVSDNDIQNHNTATIILSSSHTSYDQKVEKVTGVTSENVTSPFGSDYKPISWFDTASAESDWTAPENILKESDNKVLNLTKPAEINKDKERGPINQHHIQIHHHHYEKVNRSNKYERFTSSAWNSTTGADHVSSAAINNKNLFKGNYVWLLSVMFVSFIVFIY